MRFAALLGFIQEYRSERAIDALRQMAAPEAALLRDGTETQVPAGDSVPGDVVLLRAGDRIPADLRLVESVLQGVQLTIGPAFVAQAPLC